MPTEPPKSRDPARGPHADTAAEGIKNNGSRQPPPKVAAVGLKMIVLTPPVRAKAPSAPKAIRNSPVTRALPGAGLQAKHL